MVDAVRCGDYAPLAAVAILLSPFPSFIALLADYLSSPSIVLSLLLPPFSFLFLTLSSFIVCIARDPGLPHPSDLDHDDIPLDSRRWCPKCINPKPERSHHCSTCDRCVLKMDHHCVWLAACIGHRNQPAFIHFLAGATSLAIYAAVFGTFFLVKYFYDPFVLHPNTTFHALFLALAGTILALIIGSFLAYHIYLALTNQTTLEQVSYYHLLHYLPTIPARSDRDAVYPPKEYELSYSQRKLVRETHNSLRIYDVGYKPNYLQVFKTRPIWQLLWFGGRPCGDGSTFPRNQDAANRLSKLAAALCHDPTSTDDL